MKYHKFSAVGTLVAATLALTGCGLTADPVAEPANGGKAPAERAPAVKMEAVDACKLLSAAELRKTFGKAEYKPVGDSRTVGEPVHLTNSSCMFVAQDDATPFNVYVIVQQYDTAKSADDLGGDGTRPVGGVGEAAVSVEAAAETGPAGPPTTQVRFVAANMLVNVSKVYDADRPPGDPAADVTRVVELAKKVASRL
ncbi:hypothetical protein [Actinoplanes sp. NPDC026623]|uniref:hypothetical protein n=1 Tax=Actinoplanes sp. NPDC026623 TaxID=3155610 RepID=UPI0033FF9392